MTGAVIAQDWTEYRLPADAIKGAMPVSGVFEPGAVMNTSVNEDVCLTPTIAERNDWIHHPPRTKAPIFALVGEKEPEGFHIQTDQYVDLCQKHGMPAEKMVVEGTHHMDILDEIFRAGSPAFEKMMAQIKG